MRITSLKVYEGNNIKRQKRIIKINLVEISDKEEVKFLKNYFKVSYLIGFKEKLISIDKTKDSVDIWVSYTQEEVSTFILKNLTFEYGSINKLSEISKGFIKKGLLSEIVERGRGRIPVIELNPGVFQFGYGKNAVVVSRNYQSYENNENVLLSRDLKYLLAAFILQ